MKRIFITTAFVLGLMASVAALPALATDPDDDDICQKDNVEYTNETGTDQTLYATAFDTSDDEIIESREVETLSPGETFDDHVSIDAPDDDDILFLYSTSEITDADNLPYFDAGEPDPCKLFQDGRLNEYDVMAPATVYNIGNRFIDVYTINNGQGTLTLRVPYIQVLNSLDAAVSSGENQLIQESDPVAVYALSAGTCQMNAYGAAYVFEWDCAIAR
ncbi:MAG: hypothetical protein AAFU54_19800 [Chloroflexota bacterium]